MITTFDAAAVLEHMADGFCAFDRAWTFIFVNATAERALRRSRHELLGRNYWQTYPENLGTRIETEYRRCMETGVVIDFSLDSDGHSFDFRVYPVPGVGIAVRFRDTTQVTRAQERLRLAIETTGLGLWEYDIRTDALTWDDRAKALFGLTADDEVRGMETFVHGVHPEDRERVLGIYRAALDPDGDGRYAIEHRTVGPADGIEHWVLAKARVLFDGERRPMRAIGTLLDITARKRDEAQLRLLNDRLEARVAERTNALEAVNRELDAERARLGAILEQLPFGVLVASRSGALVFQNAAARTFMQHDMSAIQRREDFAGIGAIHEDGSPLRPEEYALVRAIERGEVTERKLQPFLTGDNRRVTLEVNAAPVRDQDGSVQLGVLAFTDVTRRLEAEEALQRAQRMEAVGQLTGGVAHDFNNLLTAILGSLELLAMRAQDSRTLRLIDTAQRAAERGAKLTGQLLAFSRKQQLQVQPVDLNAIVESMASLLSSTLGGTIAVRLSLAPELWPAIADQAQLELVILNLAINARDAMPAGGTLRIETRNVQRSAPRRAEEPPAGEFVAVTIADNGAGMTPNVLARAFEPFFTTKEIGRGSGLGLPQVLGVAQQLGGGVRIESSPETGTSATVYLPRSHAPPLGRASATAPEPEPRTERPLQDRTVLVVDDDPEVREATALALSELGAMVRLTESGDEAVRIVQSGAVFDVVLIDYAMPEMTGAEAARLIRQIAPEQRLILMTGYMPDAEPARVNDAEATLQKPFTTSELLRVIAPRT